MYYIRDVTVPKERFCCWIPIAAAGISALGSIAGGLFSSNSAKKAAQAQMDFQERMSNTAHQREVADLRAAGLNPILSAKLGGASSPGGAMPNIPDFSEAAPRAVNTALAARQFDAQLDLLESQTAKTNAETELITGKTPHDIEGAKNLARKLMVEGDLTQDQAWRIVMLTPVERDNLLQTLEKLKHETASAKGAAAQMRVIEDYLNTSVGRNLRIGGIGAEDIKRMLDAGSETLGMLLPRVPRITRRVP